MEITVYTAYHCYFLNNSVGKKIWIESENKVKEIVSLSVRNF